MADVSIKNLGEALAIALKIEKFGENYYSILADVSSDPEVKRLCQILSLQEMSHIDLIKAAILQYRNENSIEELPDVSFNPKKVFLGRHRNYDSMSVSDFFDVTIEFEDTIANIYRNARDLAQSREVFLILSSLFDFEQKHIEILKNERYKYLIGKSSINKPWQSRTMATT